MKTLLSLVVSSILLISSTSAHANSFEVHLKDQLTTETADNFAEAYQRAVEKLSLLKSVSPEELTAVLNVESTTLNESSIRLEDDSFITVHERMDADGEFSYIGVINIDISYNEYQEDD